MIRTCLIALLFVFSAGPAQSQGCTFSVNYTSYPTDAQTAFDYATELWSYKLSSAVPIKINTIYFSYPGGPLAITFSNGRKDFAGAPMDSTWYPTTLANSLAGVELNAGEFDMDIYVNGAFNWYFGTDGLTPAGKYDFVSVALHEIGHALGFTSLAKKDTTTGSIGLLEMSDFAPVVTTFPWPDQDTLPGIFDRFIENNPGTDLLTFDNPSTLLGSQLTNNQLFFNGPYTVAATGGTRARLYAPTTFSLGTSILHLNEGTYPNGNAEELMTPFVSSGHSNHSAGPMSLAMLKDMGWSLWTGINEVQPTDPTWNIFPNPAQEIFTLTLLPAGENHIVVTDATGKTIHEMTSTNEQVTLETSAYQQGFYLVKVETRNGASTRKLVIEK